MKRSAARPAGSRRKRWGWGTLMAGAFLAGLLVVGTALYWPAGEDNPPAGPSSFGTALPGRSGPPVDNTPSGAPTSRRVPRLAIIVDDLGYNPVRDAEWLAFPEKITASVLPFGPSSRSIAASARSRGFTVILHVPMEPEEPADDGTGPYRLRRGMTGGEMEAAFSRMLNDVPQATGASNHMGSAFTSDPAAMDAFAGILKGKGLFFIDSLTAARSVGAATVRLSGVQALQRDVFLDVDPRPEEMRRQWEKAIALAKERGEAILICHSRKETLAALLEMLPVLRREGIRAVTVEELLAGTPKG